MNPVMLHLARATWLKTVLTEQFRMSECMEKEKDDFQSYKNYFLIASPTMKDPSFQNTVVYLCEHTPKGAMGIVINRAVAMSVAELLGRIGISEHEASLEDTCLYDGGPVQNERGFVLHRPKFFFQSTLAITNEVMLSTSRDALQAIAQGQTKIQDCLISLGYSGWSSGQLESELAGNGWLLAPAQADIIFKTDVQDRYRAALALLGLDGFALEDWTIDEGHA